MSQVFLTAALGLVATGFADTSPHLAILDRAFLSPNAKSWLGFLVLVALAMCSIATAIIVYPEQAIVPYG